MDVLSENFFSFAPASDSNMKHTAPLSAENLCVAPHFTSEGLLHKNDTTTSDVFTGSDSHYAISALFSTETEERPPTEGSECAVNFAIDTPASYSSNIYVASLPETFTDQQLHQLFAPFGRILSVKVMCRKGTNVCKGYGFVLYEREEDAARAQASMIGHIVEGNKIQVRRARATASTPLLSGGKKPVGKRRHAKAVVPEAPPATGVALPNPFLPGLSSFPGPFFLPTGTGPSPLSCFLPSATPLYTTGMDMPMMCMMVPTATGMHVPYHIPAGAMQF